MDRGGVYFAASFLSGAIAALTASNLPVKSSAAILLFIIITIPAACIVCLHIKQLRRYRMRIHIILACSIIFCLGYSNSFRPPKDHAKSETSAFSLKIAAKKEHIKKRFINVLSQTITDPQDCAVVMAFTVGDKSHLDHTTKKAYQISGAMHVLALSGLHIGIIYNLLNILFFFLNFCYLSKQLKLILCAICIFLYAFITGFGPSVMRAGIMIITGKVLSVSGRRHNRWDVLLLSACIIVIIDPQQLTNIGFQLSYAAVAGIIAIYPTINGALEIYRKYAFYRYIKPVWSMASISIACQISTAPLALYYFNSIPLYFLITNLLAVPLVTISLYSTLFSLTTFKIPVVGDVCMFFTQQIIHLFNFVIKYIGDSL